MALTPPTDKDKANFFTNINEDKAEHGKHPNSLKNLKTWKSGESGNAVGKPLKYQALKEKLQELGNEITYDYYDKPLGTRKQQLLESLWKKAIDGSVQHAKILIWVGALDDE